MPLLGTGLRIRQIDIIVRWGWTCAPIGTKFAVQTPDASQHHMLKRNCQTFTFKHMFTPKEQKCPSNCPAVNAPFSELSRLLAELEIQTGGTWSSTRKNTQPQKVSELYGIPLCKMSPFEITAILPIHEIAGNHAATLGWICTKSHSPHPERSPIAHEKFQQFSSTPSLNFNRLSQMASGPISRDFWQSSYPLTQQILTCFANLGHSILTGDR